MRLKTLEEKQDSTNTVQISGGELAPLCGPQSESDLREISRLPDSVKELQVFDGSPTQYISWVHNVEGILKDFEIVRNKPLYRAILQHIRQKIRGNADAALISYNLFDNDWPAIKKCLSLHYADKRDIRTLEHQLNQLSQKGSRLDEFYAVVNHQFSLIINKIKTESYSEETVNALIESYRNRALDVFIRGLNGDLSRMLIIQKPKTLPEAYTACLEIQNLNFRNHTIHTASPSNTVTAPINQTLKYNDKPSPYFPKKPKAFVPRYDQFHYSPRNNYRLVAQNPPPRPTAPKPHEKMDVDRSIQSRQVNYMNRPRDDNPFKRKAYSDKFPLKQQRLFHTEVCEEDASAYEQKATENCEDEVNFMMDAYPAYHI